MATDVHLKIEGIKGEGTATKHEGEIEVLSWHWGVTHPVSYSGTGMSGGTANVQDLSVEITLKDAMISAVQTSGANGGEIPRESVTIAFGKVDYDYTPQKADGKPD